MMPIRALQLACLRLIVTQLAAGSIACLLAEQGLSTSDPDSEEALARLGSRIAAIETKLASLESRLSATLPGTGARSAAAGHQSGPAVGDDGDLPVQAQPELEGRLDALDRKIRIAARKRELDQEGAAARQKASHFLTVGKGGFSLDSADSSFQLKISGYFQADGRINVDDAPPVPDTFQITRARPVFQGTLFKLVEFRIMPDFGAGQATLQDLHLDFNMSAKARLRAGKFKSPFGLERLMSATSLPFVARAFPTQLVPNRDIGLQVYSDSRVGSTLSYAVGIFNGVPDRGSADLDTNDGKDLVARILAQPFGNRPADPLKGLGFGVAASAGRQIGALPSFKTASQATFFSYGPGITADGNRYRFSPQAYYYMGPLGLLTEYVYSSQEVRKTASIGAIQNRAWQLATSFALIGGKPSYQGLAPIRVFSTAEHTLGAFELTARFSGFCVDGEAFRRGFADPTKSARQAQSWAVGLNWYVARLSKFAINYEQTRFKGGDPLGDRATERVLLSRVQIGF